MAETRECLNIPDSEEDGDSSEGSSEDESEEDSGDEENSELIDEVLSIGKRLDSMVSSNAVEEEIGLDLLKTLSDLPITFEILKVTHIGRSVNDFRKSCKSREAATFGRSLIESWHKLNPGRKEGDEVKPDSQEIKQNTVTASMDTLEIPERSVETTESYIYVKGIHVDITRVNHIRVYEDLEKTLHRRPSIKQSNKSLRITCLDRREREILIDTQFIAGYQVSCTKPYETPRNSSNRSNRGIIFDVDVDIPTDEIELALGVTAKRNTRRVKGETINTRQVILFFENEIPEFVYFGWRRHRVSLYIPEPTRCYHCQGYGHKANRCSSRLKCPICSRNHTYEQCTAKEENREKQNAICPNCKGPHPASYKGCPKYKQAKSVIKIQTTEKVSYADAVRIRSTRLQDVNDQGKVTNSNESTTDRNIIRPRAAASELKKGSVGEQPGTVNPSDVIICSENNVSNTNTSNSKQKIFELNGKNENTPNRENIHEQCVNLDRLMNLIQSIGLLIGRSLPKNELIENLYTMINEFVQNIKSKHARNPNLN